MKFLLNSGVVFMVFFAFAHVIIAQSYQSFALAIGIAVFYFLQLKVIRKTDPNKIHSGVRVICVLFGIIGFFLFIVATFGLNNYNKVDLAGSLFIAAIGLVITICPLLFTLMAIEKNKAW